VIEPDLQSRLNSLTILQGRGFANEQIESLIEALLDFQGIDKLVD
jgi:hypothetical protein